MNLIEVQDLQTGYLDVVNHVLSKGKIVSPRGMKTLEVTGAHIIVRDTTKIIPVGIGRGLNTAIGAAESLQLLGGVSDAGQMVRISPIFAQFAVNDRLPGAYGPRTAAQFIRLVRLFGKDRDTRQGEVIIWRPWELAYPSPDVPCTVGFYFSIRDGALNMFVNMRSNDVVWGLAYDGWMFANLQHALAYALDLEVGEYHHFAMSLHIYIDRDEKLLAKLHKPEDQVETPPFFTSSMHGKSNGKPLYRWTRVTEWARRSLRCPRRTGGDATAPPLTSMKWYYDRLKEYPSIGVRCPRCRYILPQTLEHFPSWIKDKRVSNMCKECFVARKRATVREHLEALRLIQHRKCAICGCTELERELVLDHDHKTEKARGWLCRSCNCGLGQLGEKNLESAIKYLTKSVQVSADVNKITEQVWK